MNSRYPDKLPKTIIPGWYSAQQLMDIFSVTRSAVTYWAKKNKFRTLKVGKTIFCNEEDVKMFFKERKEKGQKKRGPAY